jgi:hypothetical protein
VEASTEAAIEAAALQTPRTDVAGALGDKGQEAEAEAEDGLAVTAVLGTAGEPAGSEEAQLEALEEERATGPEAGAED